MAYTFNQKNWVAGEVITANGVNRIEECLGHLVDEKQNVLYFDEVPTAGSPNLVDSNGIYNALSAINTFIIDRRPTSDSRNAVQSRGIYEALLGKQDLLIFDSTPKSSSSNPVTSQGIYQALNLKQNNLTFDSTPISDSNNPVTSKGIYQALSLKQDNLTFDNVPDSGSNNPVTSNGIYRALSLKQNNLTFDSTPILNSSNPVTSEGIYISLQNLLGEVNNSLDDLNNNFYQELITKQDKLTFDTSIAANSTSTNAPTSQAVAAFVEGKGYKTTDNNTTYSLTQDSSDGHKITLRSSSGTAQTITIPDNNTWRTVSDSVSSTASTIAASSKAVKTAYDLAASKTANTGTVTSIVAGTGLSGGTITTSGTLSVSYGNTAGTACQGNDSRLSDSRNAKDVYNWAKQPEKPTYSYNELTDLPIIPTKTSQLTNDSGFLTAHQDISGKADKSTTVSNVAYDTTNKKITKTINGTTSNVVSAATLKTDMSLSNVENKSSATIRSEITSSNVTTALGFTPLDASLKGTNSGIAELDSNGKVPSSQLPSYVDDVLEYSAKTKFPSTGETGKIYVDTATNKTYRWSGSGYIEISASLALGTTSSTAYRGDYGDAAYAHAVINKGLAFSSGLYKITTNSEGHVIAATAVAKSDITDLGIPGSNTTYTFDGTYNASTNKAATVSTVTNAIAALNISDKADKNATVSTVSYDATSKKITKTINGTTTDVISVATLKTDMSLNNVENKSSTTIRSEITFSNITTALGFIPLDATLKGANNGIAELDSNGKVLSSQLPSYIDNILEYSSFSNFPSTGETGKIYVDKNTNLTYRWSGSTYVVISPSLALGTTSSTAFRGDYGNAAYKHAVTNKGLAFDSGLYKIKTNSEGHVTAATVVTKADITALGIPGSDTTYVFDGAYNASTNKAATVSTITNAIAALKITQKNITDALGFTPLNASLKGANNGVAELDSNGKVPSYQLPADIGTILEYNSFSNFPSQGEPSKIYVALDTNKSYRWSGSQYTEISSSISLGEIQGTAYEGHKGKANALAINNLQNNKANKSTTISGYGIIDAKIENGIITLGNNTIQPIVDNNYNHTDNNFTNEEKNKLAQINIEAEKNIQSDWNITDINSDAYIKNKPNITNTIAENNNNLVTSGTIYTELIKKQDNLINVPKISEIKPTDYIYIERNQTIYKILASKLGTFTPDESDPNAIETNDDNIITDENGNEIIIDTNTTDTIVTNDGKIILTEDQRELNLG